MTSVDISDAAHHARRRGARFISGCMSAFEASSELVALCRHGTIEDVNSAGCRILGGGRDAIVGRHLCDFFGVDDADLTRRLLEVEAIERTPIPLSLRSLKGAQHAVELVVHPARELGDGRTIVTAHGVSSQPAMDAAVGLRRFRLLVQHAMHLVCQCRGDLVTYINPEGLRMLGGEGRRPADFPVARMFAAEYEDLFRHNLDDILDEAAVLPVRMRRFDGGLIDAQVLATRLPASGEGGQEYMLEARDVSAHNRAVAALRRMNETLERKVGERTSELAASKTFVEWLIETIPTPVWWKGNDGTFQGYNEAFRAFYALGGDEWIGRTVEEVLPAGYARKAQQAENRLCSGTGHTEYETTLPAAAGVRNVIINKTGWIGPDGNRAGTIGVLVDITDRKRMEEELRRMATTDSLTGVFNRRHFMDNAAVEVERAVRYDRPLSALMLDIDHFKRINDTWGHAIGDEALKALALCCSDVLRVEDMLGRLGGEEFACMLPETELAGAAALAERMRAAIEAIVVDGGNGEPVRFTSSIGVAQLTSPDWTAQTLLSRADVALYNAKQSGRNRVVVAE
jgi:diguanylate cyclase (GGDEF)-like protein/PAS domain S-box-containing protein